MKLPSALWPKWKLWHWVFAVGACVFWSDTMTAWAHAGAAPLVIPILFLVDLSPLLAVPSAIWTISRFRQSRIDRPTLWWRLGWALALLANYTLAMLWMNGVFK